MSSFVILFCLAIPVAVLARPPSSFIVGGSEAADGVWPWQLSLQYMNSHSCGAALISGRSAVSAAHCVGNAVVSYTIIAGSNQRSCEHSGENATCISRKPDSAVRHPDFINSGDSGYPNDVSVLTWITPILPSSGKIQFVTMASTTDQVGLTCYITGWGRLTATSALPENLQQAQIDVLTTEECQTLWSANQITDNQICVFDKETKARGACNGDSGGPLVCQPTLTARWELAGVTSWGRTGCSTAYPSVYTRVSAYREWILQQVPPSSNTTVYHRH